MFAEALAQYRITHPDKLLKYASKALAETGRLPDHFDAVSASAPAVAIATDDETPEQANARLMKEKEAAAVKALEDDAADAAEERAYKEDLARLELLRVKRQIAKNLAQERKAQAEAGRYRQEMLDTGGSSWLRCLELTGSCAHGAGPRAGEGALCPLGKDEAG